jgi:chaperonin GroES
MAVSFKPLHDYVLIRPDKEESVTSAGILMPTKEEDRKDKGTVVSFGQDVMDKLTEGSHVAFRQWPREELEISGEKFLLTKFENIIGIYE